MLIESPTTFTLLPVTSDDENLLRTIFHSVRAAEFEQVQGTDAAVQTLLDLQFTAQHAQYAARFPTAEHSLVIVDGAVVGRVLVDVRPDAIHLVDLSVLADAQGQGHGSAVLARLCERADAAGLPLELQVWSRNDRATRLYHRFGFAAVDEQGGYQRMLRAARIPGASTIPGHADFVGRVGHPFTVLVAPDRTEQFTLVTCSALTSAGGYASFSLTFRSAPGVAPTQGILPFSAPGFGPADLFIVPVGQTAEGTDYDVVFSHREG